MRKIFVAAFTFAGLILTPAIASARPPAVTVQFAPVAFHHVDRTAAIKQRVELTLRDATTDVSRGQRLRLVTAREANALRAQIRGIRAQLRQSLRFDGRIGLAEANRLDVSLSALRSSVAEAVRPKARQQVAWR